jgi:bifunctional DNase/RNase
LIGNVLSAFGRRWNRCRQPTCATASSTPRILDWDTRLSARVSDAVALALLLGIPIHAEDTVLDAAARAITVIPVEGDDRAQADEVEEFRRFLDTLSPDDSDTK